MGAALACVLRGGGHRVVTTLAGRGNGTAERCRWRGSKSSRIWKPSSARRTSCCPSSRGGGGGRRAILRAARASRAGGGDLRGREFRPAGIREKMAATIEARGVRFVDAAINGLAKNLTIGGTIYLSGPHAGAVAQMFASVHTIRVLGDQPGQASSMKMLLSGLSKGVCALFTELALVAERQHALPEFAEAAASIYPGIWSLIERMLPTYARHAPRRAAEMRELEETAICAGIQPCVIAAIRDLHEQLAATPFVQGKPISPCLP